MSWLNLLQKRQFFFTFLPAPVAAPGKSTALLQMCIRDRNHFIYNDHHIKNCHPLHLHRNDKHKQNLHIRITHCICKECGQTDIVSRKYVSYQNISSEKEIQNERSQNCKYHARKNIQRIFKSSNRPLQRSSNWIIKEQNCNCKP